jgi:ATP-dependent DNA helicase DinG
VPEIPVISGVSRPPERTLAQQTLELFAPEGALARVVPGFEAREGQLQMAAAVADVFSDGGVLLAEAGTGTGKTLAYLIPAILSGKRVLVSTGTKNLQEQIYFKDLPLLREALPVTFSATYMKGRGNYLCLHRFAEFRDVGMPSHDEAHYVKLIDEWRRGTPTGDRADPNFRIVSSRGCGSAPPSRIW